MLIFDFDGVLMDSVNEMAVTAYNAVTGELAMSLEELPGHVAGLFRANRFHVQQAGDVVPLMHWCLYHRDAPPDTILSADGYRALRDQAEGAIVERTAHFFATRKRFLERDPARWRRLNAPYQPIWNTLIDRGAGRVVILTNKNREATVNLCHHYGLHVRPDNIYSGDYGVTKIENLLDIQKRFRTDRHVFVDDSVGNLGELDEHFNAARPVLELMLASWGYVGPDDAARAQEAGYAVVGQDALIAMLDRTLPEAT